ncbi:hypothetical protein QYF36_011520 [Acer negundo]|nr:hypothetical protein QYF36_011520 [Acer negundo]
MSGWLTMRSFCIYCWFHGLWGFTALSLLMSPSSQSIYVIAPRQMSLAGADCAALETKKRGHGKGFLPLVSGFWGGFWLGAVAGAGVCLLCSACLGVFPGLWPC